VRVTAFIVTDEEEGNKMFISEGSQAVFTRPCGKCRLNVFTNKTADGSYSTMINKRIERVYDVRGSF
jgi:hypothetical protein